MPSNRLIEGPYKTYFSIEATSSPKSSARTFETFAHLVARESTNGDALAGLGNFFGDQFADSLGRIFNERLVDENSFFIELVQPTFDDLLDHLLGLVRHSWDRSSPARGRSRAPSRARRPELPRA